MFSGCFAKCKARGQTKTILSPKVQTRGAPSQGAAPTACAARSPVRLDLPPAHHDGDIYAQRAIANLRNHFGEVSDAKGLQLGFGDTFEVEWIIEEANPVDHGNEGIFVMEGAIFIHITKFCEDTVGVKERRIYSPSCQSRSADPPDVPRRKSVRFAVAKVGD